MNDIRELAEEFGVKAEPLIQAVEAVQQMKSYWEAQKPLIASAEPAECAHRLRQARKAIEALPLRARAHLHWRMGERIAYGACHLNAEQIHQVMESANWVDEILAALTEPLDAEPEDRQQVLRRLVQGWERAGGQVEIDDRYDGDLIEYLGVAYQYLGEILTEDAVRRRLDRIRRTPSDSEG